MSRKNIAEQLNADLSPFDVEKVRRDFPILQQQVYLEYIARQQP